MRSVVAHHQETQDPIGLGDGESAMLAVGHALTLGACFAYPAGGYVLRRRALYPTPESQWTLCGFARPDATWIESDDGVAQEADQAYQYAAARVFGNGYAGDWSEPVRVDFDAAGDLILPALPLFPQHAAARAIAAGRVVVTWEYDSFGQGGWPTDFQVFEGASPAAVNYGAPLTDLVSGLTALPYLVDRRRFQLTTPSYGDGTTHVFAVRARSSAGVAERNTFTTREVTATTAGPAAATVERALLRR